MRNSSGFNECHGSVINYSDAFETQKVKLPNRFNFLNADRKHEIDDIIDNKKSLSFMPAAISEKTLPDDYSNEYSKWSYKLVMFGTFYDGRSATIVVNGINPYIFIRIPDQYQNTEDKRQTFKHDVEGELIRYNIKYKDIIEAKIIKKKEFLGFNKSAYFIKFVFTKLTMRRHMIKMAREKNWKTATNDGSGYYKIPIRDRDLTVSSWIKLDNYEVDKENPYFKDNVVFQVDIDNIRAYTSEEILSQPKLARDHTMVMGWDIECASRSGALPVPENKEDKLFMICLGFQWHFAKNQLLKVCLVDHPISPHPDFLTIVCGNEENLLKAFASMFELMTPEYVMGFNDSGFDWPWVVARAWKYSEQTGEEIGNGVMEFMAKKMDRIVRNGDRKFYYGDKTYKSWLTQERKKMEFKKKYNNQNLKTPYNAYLSNVIRDYKKEAIKIDAETIVDGFFLQYNGCIAFDVMTIFKQLYPTAEKNSLNYFLSINNLKSKEDMEIQKMFKIYWDMTDFQKQNHNNRKTASIAEKELLDNMRDIANYCVVDSQRCPELTRVRNVIPDKRELANLSYVSIYDAFYRAGGMKVRNLVINEAQKRGYVLSNTSQKKDSDDKYPGALVFDPKTGLVAPKLTLRERVDRIKEYHEPEKDKKKQESKEIPYQNIAEINNLSQKIETFEAVISETKSSAIKLDDKEIERILNEFNKKYDKEHGFKNDMNKFKINEVLKSFLQEQSGRPITGLDFASLYPHIIMTYNLSPEYMIAKETCNQSLQKMISEAKKAIKEGHKLYKIQFQYGNQTIRGFSVRHENKIDLDNPNSKDNKFGIYPTILKKMYDKRSIIKKPAKYYEMLKEHADKLNDNIDKNNTIIDFVKNNISIVNKANNWDDLIDIEEAFEYMKKKGEYCKKDLLNLTKKEFIHGFEMKKAIDFIHKETGVNVDKVKKILNYENDFISIDEIERLFAYYNSKQLALKILMNTNYGESGNKISPFYVLTLAGGITTAGQYNLRLAKEICEQEGCDVRYGDSVTGDTPVLIGENDYVEIQDLFNEKEAIKVLKKEIYEPTDKVVWTDKGFTKIKKVIRHKTKKKLYRILTHTGLVDVTEDHSLLNSNGEKIKPSECKIGDELLHRDLPQSETEEQKDEITTETAWALGLFMANGDCMKVYVDEYGIIYLWSISNDNKDYLNRALRAFEESKYGNKFEILEKKDSCGIHKLIPKYTKKKARNLFNQFKKMFYNKEHKIVPTFIFNSSYKIRKAYFEGYWDGNYKCGKGKTLGIRGKITAAAFYKLCTSLGYNCLISSLLIQTKIYWITLKTAKFHKNPNKIKKIIDLGEVDDYVYDLETENHHFGAGIGQLIVHNTDSCYISAPESSFKELDNKYFSNKISKLEYCNGLVDITLKEIKRINDLVNQGLKRDNGTEFLKMAYEEVLFPAVFISKKKYYGLPHISVPNFNINRKIFARGIESKKRGTSEILKKVFNEEIMDKSLSIYNKKTLSDLIYEAIEYFYTNDWKVDDFIQSDRYKPVTLEDQLAGKGNTKVLLFVERMLERNIQIIPHERFKYVLVKKNPNAYDYRGRKRVLKVGERMELVSVVKKNNMPIDKDYYMNGSIIAQLARVLTYRKEFYVKPLDDSDKEIKKANDKMMNMAKQHLEEFIKNKGFSDTYYNIGPIKQKIFRTTERILVGKIKDAITLERESEKIVFMDWKDDIDESFKIMKEKIDKLAKKNSIDYGDKYVKFVLNSNHNKGNMDKEMIMNNIGKLYSSRNDVGYRQIIEMKEEIITEAEYKFRGLFRPLMKFVHKYRNIIDEMSKIIDKELSSCYDKYYEPVSRTKKEETKNEDNFDVIKRMDLLSLAEKYNKKIPYDELNNVADIAIIELHKDYELLNLIKEIKEIQNNIYAILCLYYQTESISDYIIAYNDKKNNLNIAPQMFRYEDMQRFRQTQGPIIRDF